jgi:hypothetical protein
MPQSPPTKVDRASFPGDLTGRFTHPGGLPSLVPAARLSKA